jgi:hypothetical protein
LRLREQVIAERFRNPLRPTQKGGFALSRCQWNRREKETARATAKQSARRAAKQVAEKSELCLRGSAGAG